MKYLLYPGLLLAIFMSCSQFCFGQRDTVYFDNDWHPASRTNARYYRYIDKQADGIYKITDHYQNGVIQMEGALTSLDTPEDKYRTGYHTFYSESGKVIDKGSYQNGKREGEWIYYYTDTNIVSIRYHFKHDSLYGIAYYYDSVPNALIAIGSFTDSKKSGEWKYFNKRGTLTRTEEYSTDSIPITVFYDETGKKLSEGVLIDDKRYGEWKFYTRNGELIYRNHYDYGLLNGEVIGYYVDGHIRKREYYCYETKISGECYDDNGNVIPYYDEPDIRSPIPEYDISEYLYEHLEYPKGARIKKISGKVVIGFFVNIDGSISGTRVIQGIGGGCDAESLRLVDHMPNWKPGTINGRKAKVFKTLTIEYRLPMN